MTFPWRSGSFMWAMGRRALVALQLLATLGLVTAVLGSGHAEAKRKPKPPPARGIHKIKHVIVIMQENRSFDSYFGTFQAPTGSRRTCACRTRRTAAASGPTTTPTT